MENKRYRLKHIRERIYEELDEFKTETGDTAVNFKVYLPDGVVRYCSVLKSYVVREFEEIVQE